MTLRSILCPILRHGLPMCKVLASNVKIIVELRLLIPLPRLFYSILNELIFGQNELHQNQMGIKLYGVDLSPPVRAAMMAFEIFNVPYEKIELNLIANEHKTPEYLKKNPLHSVPLMEDGDFILHDSHAIMAYLSDVHGKDDSLYPKDVKTRALVNQKLFFDTSILFPRLRNVTYPIVIEGHNTIEQKKIDDIAEAYDFFEAFLSRTTYLAADHVTIADVAALANMTTLEFLVPVDAKKYPKTTAWLTTLKNTPYCRKRNEPGAVLLDEIVKKGISSS